MRMNHQTTVSFYYLFFLLLIFCYIVANFEQTNNLFISTSNLSIIIETDFFDCDTFTKIWKPIITDIPLYITSFYFFVHYTNGLNKTSKKKENLYEIKNLKWAKVVISDLPENGYLPLMISSYGLNMYPPTIILYINASNYDYNQRKKSGLNNKNHLSELFKPPSENKLINNGFYNENSHQFKTVLSKWITNSFYKHLNDPNLSSIFGFKTEIQTSIENRQNFVGCDVVMVKESIVRELLFYSNSTMNSQPSFLSLSMINSQKVHNSYDLFSTETIGKIYGIKPRINERFQCPKKLNETKKDYTFSIFIPCFKRNYFKGLFKNFSKQIYQPSYYVLIQNRYYVSLDVENKFYKYIKSNKRPIYKIWMVNFNSFFILPNLITSLLDTDFVIRFDDDHFPLFKNITKYVLDAAIKKNMKIDSIIGHRASVLNRRIFAFQRFGNIFCHHHNVDYVASPYIYRPQQMKISGRVKPFFLAGGEDFQLGLVASIQCGTMSYYLNFNIFDHSDDRKKHILDREIQKYYNDHRYNELPDYFSHSVYAYYIQIGYKPKCWNNFKLYENEKINGVEYKHKSFF